MPGQITSAYQLPPHRMTKALSRGTVSSRNGEGVNGHALNAKSHILGAMEGITAILRFFITMKELSSLNLMNCTCYVVISPSILCTLWKAGLMNLCWTMNSLSPVTLLVVEDCCTLEICHTMPCLWITCNCHCIMVVATTFVSMHCTVYLPPLPLFCNIKQLLIYAES